MKNLLTRKYPFGQSKHWLRDSVIYGVIIWAILYLLQHLDKVEKKVDQLANSSSGINRMHFNDLKLKLEKIKGEYNKVEK